MLIENDGSLSSDFGAKYDYYSRGGVLADAVGMDKTATKIALIASDKRQRGDTHWSWPQAI
jgi:SNF2 family DNA or RNA helicase